MNSRQKGKRGERLWRDELRAQGYAARRGQQFCGSSESPDVVCEALPHFHFEVKCVERLNIEDAMDQARCDCETRNAERGARNREPKVPVVAHKRRHRRWLVTMDAETFFRFLRGDFDTSPFPNTEIAKAETLRSESGAHGVRRPTEYESGGRSATRPTTEEMFGGAPNMTGGSPVPPNQISAAACAAANHNNTEQNGTRVTRPSNEEEK